mmetsp:Transcript_1216/g.2216  ORF Transcript_1216/g.2216 Transcript_1216/m.2216 type:complete len:205 (+) Transcript_1216:705-1319(+)
MTLLLLGLSRIILHIIIIILIVLLVPSQCTTNTNTTTIHSCFHRQLPQFPLPPLSLTLRLSLLHQTSQPHLLPRLSFRKIQTFRQGCKIRINRRIISQPPSICCQSLIQWNRISPCILPIRYTSRDIPCHSFFLGKFFRRCMEHWNEIFGRTRWCLEMLMFRWHHGINLCGYHLYNPLGSGGIITWCIGIRRIFNKLRLFFLIL